MAARQEQINLLPEKGFETTTTGRLLAWILSTFRIIVIVTEIIVMIAFLSRFWLDAQNTDLGEAIEEKKAALSSSLNFETQFKDNQKRLKIFSELTSSGKLFTNSLEAITSYLPDDLYLTSVTFNKDSIEVEGASPNERSIQQFLVNLGSSDLFTEVGLVSIKTDPENSNLLIFKLNAKMASVGGKSL